MVEGLDLPLFVTHAPCDYDRLFIVERGGAVRILDLTTGQLKPKPFVEVEARGYFDCADNA